MKSRPTNTIQVGPPPPIKYNTERGKFVYQFDTLYTKLKGNTKAELYKGNQSRDKKMYLLMVDIISWSSNISHL